VRARSVVALAVVVLIVGGILAAWVTAPFWMPALSVRDAVPVAPYRDVGEICSPWFASCPDVRAAD
jgi:predicted exporter